MKVIISGAGQVGYQIARYLSREGIDVTLIDLNESLIKKATEILDVKGIVGFSSHPNILKNAGAYDADMIIAVTHLDEINMITCQVAYSLFNVPMTIARVRHQNYLDPVWSNLYDRDHLPIDVTISPEAEVAQAITRRLHVPGAFDMIRLADDRVTVVGIRCTENCPIINTPLNQLSTLFPDLNVVTVGIIRNEKRISPVGSDQMLIDDEVYCVVETNQLQRLMAAFGYEEDEAHRIVIVGAGNIGLFLAQQIEDEFPNVSIKLIELNEERASEAAQALPKTLVLKGDILDPEILEAAKIKQTDTFITVTDDDEVNILASLLAKRYGCPRVLTLVNTYTYQSLLPTLGIDVVINPRAITVSTILHHIRRGRIRAVHSLREGFGEIIDAEAIESLSLVGRTIQDAHLPTGVMVGAILRGNTYISPRRDTIIENHDRVILFVPSESVKKVEKLFSVRLEFF